MSKHISVVFPGQGSQSLGMLDFFSDNEILSTGYSPDIFDFNLIDIIKNDSISLDKSFYTQPAIVLSSIAYFKKLIRILPNMPDIFAGHSLGEYSALVASNSLDINTALSLVHKRGRLMSESSNGAMLAVMGLSMEKIINVCNIINKNDSESIELANINSSNQVVLGGYDSSIEISIDLLKEAGAKRCIKLKVSTASHCSLMKEVSLKFKDELDKINIQEPERDVIQNIDAKAHSDVHSIKLNLADQLTHPVQWIETMKTINIHKGIIIECGPGKVLSGLAKANGLDNILTMSSNTFEEDLRSLL